MGYPINGSQSYIYRSLLVYDNPVIFRINCEFIKISLLVQSSQLCLFNYLVFILCIRCTHGNSIFLGTYNLDSLNPR